MDTSENKVEETATESNAMVVTPSILIRQNTKIGAF